MPLLVDKPRELTYESVRESLMHVVPLCLDNDPSLIPHSCKSQDAASTPATDAGVEADGEGESESPVASEDGRDPDDFRFWSERQAKRISLAIEQAFGVELTPAVVLADANVGALANRILVSKELLSE